MNTQRTFTKDNLDVKRVGYSAEPTGTGEIYLVVNGGEIIVDIESYLGEIAYESFAFVSDNIDSKCYYYYLDDQSIETVQEYMKDNNIFDKYMDEVYEAVNQTF